MAYLQYRIVELYIKRAYLASMLGTLMPFAQSTLDTIKQNSYGKLLATGI